MIIRGYLSCLFESCFLVNEESANTAHRLTMQLIICNPRKEKIIGLCMTAGIWMLYGIIVS